MAIKPWHRNNWGQSKINPNLVLEPTCRRLKNGVRPKEDTETNSQAIRCISEISQRDIWHPSYSSNEQLFREWNKVDFPKPIAIVSGNPFHSIPETTGNWQLLLKGV